MSLLDDIKNSLGSLHYILRGKSLEQTHGNSKQFLASKAPQTPTYSQPKPLPLYRQVGNQIEPLFENAVKAAKEGYRVTKGPFDTVLDWTLRPVVTKPAAKTVLSTVGERFGVSRLPVNDSAGRLLFGEGDITSYQEDQRGTTSFLGELGVPGAAPLGMVAGVANMALDAPVGLAKKPVKELAEAGAKKLAKKDLGKLVREAMHSDVKTGRAKLTQIAKAMTGTPTQATVAATKAIPENFVNAFKSWVNARRATEISGVQAKNLFKALDAEGFKAIEKVQKPNTAGAYKQVRDYFDRTFAALRDAGVDISYKREYLPQLWANSKEEVDKVFKKALSQRPAFTQKSVFETYKEGTRNGLTPRYTKITDLVGWYTVKAKKLLADKAFLDYLKDNELIMSASKAPKDWVRITAQGFPTNKIKTEAGDYIDELFSAPPELAKAIDNYLTEPTGKLVTTGKFMTAAKNRALAAGVPGTALNFHGFNIFVRGLTSADNPISHLFKTTKWFVAPGTADNFVTQNLAKARKFSEHGLTLTAEDVAFTQPARKLEGNLASKSLQVLGETYDKWLSDPLFKKTIPALKINYADQVYRDLIKNLPEKEALSQASRTANEVFGGMNLDELMRDKHTQTVLRNLILAPDWAESNIRMGAGVVKGLLNPANPKLKAYRTVARNVFAAYILANVYNKMLSGHWMFQNEGNNGFNLDTGSYTDDGKKRYFRLFGTGIDFLRVPYDVISSLVRGNLGGAFEPIANRLSMPVSAGMHLLTNQDYKHAPIYGNDRYGNPIPVSSQIGGITNEALQAVGVPSQLRTGVDFATGRINPEQAAMQLIEAPMKYSGGAYSKSAKERQKTFQAAGLTGEELANAMETNAGKRSFAPDEPGFLDGLMSFFRGEEQTPTQSDDPLVAAFMEDTEKDRKASRIREVFGYGLNREGIEKILEKEGLGDYETASVTVLKSLGIENGSRPAYLKQYLSSQGPDATKTIDWLVKNKVLTNAVVDYWEESGDLTPDQADAMKTQIKTAKGNTKKKKYPKISLGQFRTPKASNRIRVRAPKLPNIRISPKPMSPKISRPTVRTAYEYR